MVDGPMVPPVSLLGVQTVSRAWQSWENTLFVMAMLTVEGLVRLFPAAGESVDELLDLGSLIGDAATLGLRSHLDAASTPSRVVEELDRWFLSRLDLVAITQEFRRLSAAHRMLVNGASVETAAGAAEVSRRQLSRWYNVHLGLGPKQISSLERLQRSVYAAQTGKWDLQHGFTDQAHVIRAWKIRLGTTPGAYLRSGPSLLAHELMKSGSGEHLFYL